ncbi:MAG: DNA repair protein RecN [Elusimicrobiota bacterium]
MLRLLRVKNFAVIDELSFEPGPGLNALTGETGAGKSIIVEALGFALGGRGSSLWLRSGEDRLLAEASFDAADFSAEVRSRFNVNEGRAVLRREMDSSGKSRSFLNGHAVSAAVLAEIGSDLVDFHGQHEHQSLMREAKHLDILDRFGGLEKQRAEVEKGFTRWSDLKAEIESAGMSEEERSRRMDLLRYQIQEIERAGIGAGEEDELEILLPRLRNGDRLRALASSAHDALYDQDGSASSGLLKAERALVELAKIDQSLANLSESVSSARVAVDEAARELGAYQDRLDVDPHKLEETLSRLEKISLLKKKYGPASSDVAASLERFRAEMARMENFHERSGLAEKELSDAARDLDETCVKIHQARLKSAENLSRALDKELRGLGFAQARFSAAVEMEEGVYRKTGADAVEFMFSANPGEPPRPLKDVASGGELSRLMLALKTVLARADRVPVLVFDEVDSGVGAETARTVGQKLSGLSRARQVLCVTHLPQVSCWAHNHFFAIKSSAQGRTRVSLERLEGERRVEILALMLGGRQATAASRKHAQELLESCAS